MCRLEKMLPGRRAVIYPAGRLRREDLQLLLATFVTVQPADHGKCLVRLDNVEADTSVIRWEPTEVHSVVACVEREASSIKPGNWGAGKRMRPLDFTRLHQLSRHIKWFQVDALNAEKVDSKRVAALMGLAERINLLPEHINLIYEATTMNQEDNEREAARFRKGTSTYCRLPILALHIELAQLLQKRLDNILKICPRAKDRESSVAAVLVQYFHSEKDHEDKQHYWESLCEDFHLQGFSHSDFATNLLNILHSREESIRPSGKLSHSTSPSDLQGPDQVHEVPWISSSHLSRQSSNSTSHTDRVTVLNQFQPNHKGKEARRIRGVLVRRSLPRTEFVPNQPEVGVSEDRQYDHSNVRAQLGNPEDRTQSMPIDEHLANDPIEFLPGSILTRASFGLFKRAL